MPKRNNHGMGDFEYCSIDPRSVFSFDFPKGFRTAMGINWDISLIYPMKEKQGSIHWPFVAKRRAIHMKSPIPSALSFVSREGAVGVMSRRV
jgi:hypothetical protein